MELKYELRENGKSLWASGRGWGNGYVHLPPDHPCHGVHYREIPVDVHGDLTYSETERGAWVVGFDTMHSGDTLENWPQEAVEAETLRLKEQLERLAEPTEK